MYFPLLPLDGRSGERLMIDCTAQLSARRAAKPPTNGVNKREKSLRLHSVTPYTGRRMHAALAASQPHASAIPTRHNGAHLTEAVDEADRGAHVGPEHLRDQGVHPSAGHRAPLADADRRQD